MSTLPMSAFKDVSKDDVLDAIKRLNAGQKHAFDPSEDYDVISEGPPHAPKAVWGLAAERSVGRPLVPDDFNTSTARKKLGALGFKIVKKHQSAGTDKTRRPRYWAIALGEQGRLWNECQEQGIIAIGWDYLGDLSEYESQEQISEAIAAHDELPGDVVPMNQSLACWQFVHDIQPGDYAVVKVGRSRIVGLGIVQGDCVYDENRSEYKSIRSTKWLAAKDLELSREMLLPTKTLTEVTDFAALVNFINDNYLEEKVVDAAEIEPFTIESATDGIFMPQAHFEHILDSLKAKKNVILSGPPGVGKTFLAWRLAFALMGTKDKSRGEMIQFHQSYSYEDFIQGLRPKDDGTFRLRNGVFYEFCNKARADIQRPYVFIIDEINRGNLSKIFGELMMLIECDKRGSEYAINLTYSEPGERFSVPENVYLLGLMNTADRSLAMVDYALRRRFRFVEVRPQFGEPSFREHLRQRGGSKELIERLITRIGDLNAKIAADHKNLGRGFVVGHSYFCPGPAQQVDEAWYQSVIKSEIAPLIEEYWFDRPEMAGKWIEELKAQ